MTFDECVDRLIVDFADVISSVRPYGLHIEYVKKPRFVYFNFTDNDILGRVADRTDVFNSVTCFVNVDKVFIPRLDDDGTYVYIDTYILPTDNITEEFYQRRVAMLRRALSYIQRIQHESRKLQVNSEIDNLLAASEN